MEWNAHLFCPFSLFYLMIVLRVLIYFLYWVWNAHLEKLSHSCPTQHHICFLPHQLGLCEKATWEAERHVESFCTEQLNITKRGEEESKQIPAGYIIWMECNVVRLKASDTAWNELNFSPESLKFCSYCSKKRSLSLREVKIIQWE